jgi:PAS domain S-box-containing protein
MNLCVASDKWDRSPGAIENDFKQSEDVFQSLFERSADAIWLYDPATGMLVDCNQAAVKLIGAQDKRQLLPARPEDLSPAIQPDGLSSEEKSVSVVDAVKKEKTHRFEWMIRRRDGVDVPIEVSATVVRMGDKNMHVVISRDISERKNAERELRELTQALERRVSERTAELTASEARLRAMVEHAPEAIVVYSVETGRFLFGNQHACDLYGVPMSKLAELTPMDVSPEFQCDGRLSSEVAREKVSEVLTGKTAVCEWTHRRPDGELIPTEVRLLLLPSEGKKLIRASIIDNTERKRAERALRESEAKFRALFEGASQGVVVHDETQLLEVNPAAVRILRRKSAQDVLGKHPGDFSPSFQPNGERSDVVARRHIYECMTNGSARFDWVASDPHGHEISLEVSLTRIQWSGRQVIQGFITDISARKQAELALREANRELHREIEQRTRAEESLKERVRISTLDAEVAVALNAGGELQPMLQRCCELAVQHLDVAFARIWTLNAATQMLELQSSAGAYTHLDGAHSRVKVGQYKIGLIAQNKEPLLTNKVRTDPRISDLDWAAREGMVAFAGYPLLIENRVLGVLGMFARHPLGDDVLTTLRSIADSVALGIERKRGEEGLRASEARLRESEAKFSVAFQASPVAIVIMRMDDGSCVLANKSFLEWIGCSREEVIGRNSLELGMWADPKERAGFWSELRVTRSIHQREGRMRNRYGKSFIMLLSADVIEIGGEPHVLAVGTDITERKRVQAALEESEARFSAAFHASPALIGVLRMSDGKYVLVNDAHVNWVGYSREEILGRRCIDLGMWENPDDRELLLKEASAEGSVRHRECRWRNRRGEQFTVLLSAETIRLADAPHLLLTALDITQRKRAEEELRASETRLRESEARFTVAFETSPMFINILRLSDGNHVWANDAFVNRLGYSREDVLGRPSTDFGMWVDAAERDAAWETMRTAGSIRQREVRWLDRRGVPFTILLSAEMIQFNGEQHILSLALDITERKRAEVELLKTLEREKELSQLKSNFVSMVSHEFRTPLGIIQSSAELLHDFQEKMKPDERAEQLSSIARNTRRMAGMMEEVLVLSRLDAGKLEFQPVVLDFSVFCRRAVDEALSASSRRCLIKLSLAEALPEARADEQLLGHIFTNLLSNAVKYSEAGSPVHFTILRNGPDVVCVIRDTGIGIPEVDQQQLFKTFYRGSNVGNLPGTGLGLVLVKRCVELHGGKLQLQSALGEGTTVTITLPVFGANHEKDTGH